MTTNDTLGTTADVPVLGEYKPAVDRHMMLCEVIHVLSLMPRGAYLYIDDHMYRGKRAFEFPVLEVESREGTADITFASDEHVEPVCVGEFVDFLKTLQGAVLAPENRFLIDGECYVWLTDFEAAVNGVRMNGDGSVTFSYAYPD